MPSKASIYIYARNIAAYYKGLQPNGEVRDWELLKDIYDQAMEVPPRWDPLPQGSNLEAIKKGRWLAKNGIPGGTSSESAGVAWCGIFATYVLLGVGVPVKWRKGVGIGPLEPYLELCTYNKSDEIEPGDICVKGTNQHHFIVHNRIGDKIFSYDGNLPGQSIGERNYTISDMKKMAKDADIDMGQKLKTMSKEEFQRYLQTHPKYNFYFYRLKKF
jgi:hypothetical protein